MHTIHFIHLVILSSLCTAFPSPLNETLTPAPNPQPRDSPNSIFFATACPPLTLSLAGPLATRHAPTALHRRSTPGGLYVCTQAGWRGICHYEVVGLGTCWGVTPAVGWDGSIAALGPDPGAACAVWSAPAALGGGQAAVAVWPGWSDLAAMGWGPGTGADVMGVYCWAL